MTVRRARWGTFLAVVAALLAMIVGVVPLYASHTAPPSGTSPEGPGGPNGPSTVPSDPWEEEDEGCPPQGKSPSPQSGGGTAGAPIYLFDGGFYHRYADLTIPGRIPIVIRRSYDSRSAFNGLMGYGWSFNYHMRVFPLADGNLLLKRGDSVKDTFTDNGDNTYSSPAARYETITRNPDGTYTLGRKSGFRYEFDVDGKLTEIRNPRGNQLLFRYDPGGLQPINGLSHFTTLETPILIGYDYRLTRIDEAFDGVTTGRYIELTYNANGRVERIEDFAGRRLIYAYDPAGTGDLLTVTDPEDNLYEYTYDANHRMLTFTGGGCSSCSTYANAYDDQGRCIQQTHGSLVIDIDYVEPLAQTKVTTWIYDDDSPDPENPILLHTRYEYYEFDSGGRTTKLTRQMGNELDEADGSTETDDIVTTWEYYADGPNEGRPAVQVDPRGVRTDYTYDDRGNLQEELLTDPEDSGNWWKTAYEYNDPNAPNQFSAREVSATFDPIYPQTYRTEWSYYPNGRIEEMRQFPDDTTTYTTHYTYTTAGDLLTRTDPRDNTIEYEYDNAFGFWTREFDPANEAHQTTRTLTALADIAAITDANGHTTNTEYDSLRRTRVVTNALSQQTVFTYTGPNLTEIEYGRTATRAGQKATIEYDMLNRTIAWKGADDDGAPVLLSGISYDSEGRQLRQTDGNDNSTSWAYDVLGRIESTATALGHATEYAYDKAGNLVAAVDAELNETSANFDFLNRQTTFHYGESHSIQSSYTATGEVSRMVDDNLHPTVFRYDRLSRLIEEEDANGHITAYCYDGNGNVVGKITPNDWTAACRTCGELCSLECATVCPAIAYGYDAYNRLEAVDYPDSTADVTYTYDLVGNQLSWDNSMFSETTTYDVLDRRETRTTDYPGFAKTVSYTYDPTGDVKSVTDGEGRTTFYHRNALGRLRYIGHPGSLFTEYEYDTGGRLTERTLPNGVAMTLSYFDDDRIETLANEGSPGTLSSFAYTYDNVGNRKSMTTLTGTHSYEYNDIYQLESATHPEPGNPIETYTYDGVQNRLASAEHADWSYDETNFLDSYDSYTFGSDEAGNTISTSGPEGTTTYAYDAESRLIQADTPTHLVTFGYSPSGRRLSKTVDGVVTLYLYDREDVIGEYGTSGVLQRAYLHGQDIDEPIAMIDGDGMFPTGDLDHTGAVDLEDYALLAGMLQGPGNSVGMSGDLDGDGDTDLADFGIIQTQFDATGSPVGVYFYVQDGLGSVVGLSSATGSSIEQYVYTSFGTPVGGPSSLGNPYLYASRELDGETQLYYYRTRYYRSLLGRFTTRDSIGTWGDLANAGNAYAYVANNPMLFTDPFGMLIGHCPEGQTMKPFPVPRCRFFGLICADKQPPPIVKCAPDVKEPKPSPTPSPTPR